MTQPEKHKRTCPICSTQFQPKSGNQIHCKTKCRLLAIQKRRFARYDLNNDFYDELMDDPEFRELALNLDLGNIGEEG